MMTVVREWNRVMEELWLSSPRHLVMAEEPRVLRVMRIMMMMMMSRVCRNLSIFSRTESVVTLASMYG